jgi:hypothetical protein
MPAARRFTWHPRVAATLSGVIARLLPLSLLALLLACCATPGPPPRERAPIEPIPAAALQRDVDVLEQALVRLHPGLYRYNSPAQVASSVAALRRELNHDASLPEAWLAFSRFTASLRCGHTYPNPVNQSAAVQSRLFDAATRLPFHFRWLGGRMVVLRNFSGDARLAPGTEVLSVAGVPASTLLARMLPLVRADGHNDDKRLSLLEVAGREKYEAFDVLLPMLFPQAGDAPLLRVQPLGAIRPLELRVQAQTAAQRLAQRRQAADSRQAPPWSLRWLDGGIAVLDMPSWAVYDGRWDWRDWLQRIFSDERLLRAPALVIDLRENEGGADVGSELLAHLVDREVPLPGYVRKTRYRTSPPELRPYLDTWDPSFHDWGDEATPLGDGFYRLERAGLSAEGERVQPVAPHFRGRVFVLTSAVNSSATFDFARDVRRAGIGTLVGQTTGGNLRGINGGAFFFLNLPNSRIEIDLPLIGQFPLEPQPDAGLRPDIEVRASAADLASGRDLELEAVRQALR